MKRSRAGSVALSAELTICCARAALCQIATLASLEIDAGLQQTDYLVVTNQAPRRYGLSVFSSFDVYCHLEFDRHLNLQLHHVGCDHTTRTQAVHDF
jgi:hypothetical protein